jgi:ribosome maturation factor RimP
MAKSKVEDIIESICTPITEGLGLNLIDVEYKKEGNGYILRVIIDKPEGIDIDDCENVSRELDAKLDEIDPIESSYNLEVQSPGERNLRKDKEFEYSKERDVEVKLFEAYEGKRIYEGKLLGLDNGIIKILQDNGEEKQFSKEKAANVKLKINF